MPKYDGNWKAVIAFLVVLVAVVMIALAFMPIHGEICEGYDHGQYHDCAPSNLVLVAWWHIKETLDGSLITAIATIAIAAFTLTLKQSTDRLWAVGVKQAAIAERTLTDLEVPYIFVKFIENGISVDAYANPPRCDLNVLRYRFVNHGRTPAIIINYAEEIIPRARGSGYPPPLDTEREFFSQIIGWGLVVPPNDTSAEIPKNLLPQAMTKAGAGLSDASNNVYAIFAVRYMDIFGKKYSTGFCFKFDWSNGWTLTSADDRYNYRRKEA